MGKPLVPDDFDVPLSFVGPGFRLEPLGPEHNERDHDAWMSSLDHINATPGFSDEGWPAPMSLDSNLRDLVAHATHFTDRVGFTYSILDGDEVIGCIYIYPSAIEDFDASVSSWVRASRAEMDVVVWREMSEWLANDWPFVRFDYGARG
jgi:hypothetical protein